MIASSLTLSGDGLESQPARWQEGEPASDFDLRSVLWRDQKGLSNRVRKPRLALYSHDAMGIGHMRRNLLIAQTLMESRQVADCLLIAGARQAAAFSMRSGIDCVTLPSLYKHATGRYCSQSLRMSFKRLIGMRGGIIHSALAAYKPDVLLVDKTPCGVAGELGSSLEMLRSEGRTRCVLGLRDVLDEPAQVEREWRRSANADAIAAFYDSLWIYGDPRIYDAIREYGFPPQIAAKVRYTGYFDQRVRLRLAQPEELLTQLGIPPRRLVLCMLGGGQDGEFLARAFIAAELPEDTVGVLVTGPCMPLPVRQDLQSAAASSPRVRVVEFLREPSLLLPFAERVVIMGGYNTVTEVLAFGKRPLVVPRVAPRQEQWIRAQRLEQLGLVDVLHPAEVDPAAISCWLGHDLPPLVAVHDRIDFGGLNRLPEYLQELFAPPSVAGRAARLVPLPPTAPQPSGRKDIA